MYRRSEALRTMTRWLILMVAGILTTACATTYDQSAEIALPAEKLQFANINPKITMATAYGDRSAGEHGTFGTFPAHFMTPWHTHSGAYHGVVIKGTMTNPFAGEKNPPKMSAGSYWYVPANAVHATACVSATPCEFYFHAQSAFDFKVVKQ